MDRGDIGSLFDPNNVVDDEKEKAESLTCSICFDLMKDPAETECGHRFCQACVLDSLEKINECPECRHKLTIASIHGSRYTSREVMSLTVHCPKSELGCDWTGPLNKLLTKNPKELHFNECGFVPIVCEFCGKQLLRSQTTSHADTECPNQKSQCRHCKQKYLKRESQQHKSACLMQLVQCPNGCQTLPEGGILRKLLATHQLSECPKELVKCNFAKYGCQSIQKRIDLKDHDRHFEVSHLSMQLKYEQNLRIQQEKDFEVEKSTLLARIAELEKLYTQQEGTISSLLGNIDEKPRGDVAPNNSKTVLNNSEEKESSSWRDSIWGPPSQSSSASVGKSSFSFIPALMSHKPEAEVVKSLSYPDKTRVGCNQTIIKSWLMKNIGYRKWPEDTKLTYIKGDNLGDNQFDVISCNPGMTAEISAVLEIPSKPGRYSAYYRLKANGQVFGDRVWYDLFVDESIIDDVPHLEAKPKSFPGAKSKKKKSKLSFSELTSQDQLALQTIQGMGFSRDQTLSAYLNCSKDASRAVDYLLFHS